MCKNVHFHKSRTTKSTPNVFSPSSPSSSTTARDPPKLHHHPTVPFLYCGDSCKTRKYDLADRLPLSCLTSKEKSTSFMIECCSTDFCNHNKLLTLPEPGIHFVAPFISILYIFRRYFCLVSLKKSYFIRCL